MPQRPTPTTARAPFLLLALVAAGLIAWAWSEPSRDEAQVTVQFRTAPFDFGHERVAPAEFLFAARPPLA
jgi:small-conductance mechanosensitive channel